MSQNAQIKKIIDVFESFSGKNFPSTFIEFIRDFLLSVYNTARKTDIFHQTYELI